MDIIKQRIFFCYTARSQNGIAPIFGALLLENLDAVSSKCRIKLLRQVDGMCKIVHRYNLACALNMMLWIFCKEN